MGTIQCGGISPEPCVCVLFIDVYSIYRCARDTCTIRERRKAVALQACSLLPRIRASMHRVVCVRARACLSGLVISFLHAFISVVVRGCLCVCVCDACAADWLDVYACICICM